MKQPSHHAAPTTGRLLVLLRDTEVAPALAALRAAAGPHVACTLDFADGAAAGDAVADAHAVLYDRLGVAVVNVTAGDEEGHRRVRALVTRAVDARVLAVEPERAVHAYPRATPSKPAKPPRKKPPVGDDLGESGEAKVTWGLQATGVPKSAFSGKGTKVAVLDTGFDLTHPDFPSRTVVTQSFVKGVATAQDVHGHGTHCIGTACGPKEPFHLPRYGIAFEAAIYAGKVLDDQGGGGDAGILAGINWAVTQKVNVVSMSLGAEVTVDDAYSRVFETAARRALAAGSLIVAAAGNESDRREGWYAPVGHPANCPSILAVGAVDAAMKVAFFSNRGLVADGGQVDVAAPGVNVYSSFPMPERNARLSGTSMATPHVAGIAALFAEANPKATAAELWTLLAQHARRLPLLSTDVGAGLVMAP